MHQKKKKVTRHSKSAVRVFKKANDIFGDEFEIYVANKRKLKAAKKEMNESSRRSAHKEGVTESVASEKNVMRIV